MKKILLSFAALSSISISLAQYTEDFETPLLTVDTAWFGQDQVTDGDTIYSNGAMNFELSYNSSWQTFTGFAVSSMTDVSTPGYSNQFSAITGGGVGNSNQYAICYASQYSNNRVFIDDTYAWKLFDGVYVTNTTYAYYSMLNGDMFAKPFGADTNAQGQIDGTNGEDWFLLTIYALGADSMYTGDSVNFYLADYTFANNADDYIVDDWQFIDLSTLGSPVYGLDFVLSSSDTSGGLGMNTPAYFAMDMLGGGYENIANYNSLKLNTYPNPVTDQLYITAELGATVRLTDLLGNLLKETYADQTELIWNLSDIKSGVYIINVEKEGQFRQQKIIKQ